MNIKVAIAVLGYFQKLVTLLSVTKEEKICEKLIEIHSSLLFKEPVVC